MNERWLLTTILTFFFLTTTTRHINWTLKQFVYSRSRVRLNHHHLLNTTYHPMPLHLQALFPTPFQKHWQISHIKNKKLKANTVILFSSKIITLSHQRLQFLLLIFFFFQLFKCCTSPSPTITIFPFYVKPPPNKEQALPPLGRATV